MPKYLRPASAQLKPVIAAGRVADRKKNTRSRSGASARKGASPRSKSTPTSIDASLSQYRVAATLLVAAVFVAAIFFLTRLDMPASESPPTQNTPVEKTTRPNSDAEFTFYSMLHDLEIEIPETAASQMGDSKHGAARYVIQAGSFKTAAQAERRLVELKLLGLNPRAGEVENANGERWHRVMLGPFATRSQMAGARGVMINNNIEAMVMQRKP